MIYRVSDETSLFWPNVDTAMARLRLPRMNKKVLTVATLQDPSDAKDYWLSRTPYERLRMVEILRRINYGPRACTARLQRVLEITELKKR